MFRLFETIRVVDGIPQHLPWHERRMELARMEFWGIDEPVHLSGQINVPAEFSIGIIRCNVVYSPGIQEVTFKPWKKKIIRSLRLVYDDTIEYHVKYTNRTRLEDLLRGRGDCDEILIVKDGSITDTSISNIILYNGEKWLTPDTPLLPGTTRERLLYEGMIVSHSCTPSYLHSCLGIKLINAMRLPEEEEMIPVSSVR